jgi:hypothetical protein
MDDSLFLFLLVLVLLALFPAAALRGAFPLLPPALLESPLGLGMRVHLIQRWLKNDFLPWRNDTVMGGPIEGF